MLKCPLVVMLLGHLCCKERQNSCFLSLKRVLYASWSYPSVLNFIHPCSLFLLTLPAGWTSWQSQLNKAANLKDDCSFHLVTPTTPCFQGENPFESGPRFHHHWCTCQWVHSWVFISWPSFAEVLLKLQLPETFPGNISLTHNAAF